jgi:hypothetical protein
MAFTPGSVFFANGKGDLSCFVNLVLYMILICSVVCGCNTVYHAWTMRMLLLCSGMCHLSFPETLVSSTKIFTFLPVVSEPYACLIIKITSSLFFPLGQQFIFLIEPR